MEIENDWDLVKSHFKKSFKSSFHFSVSSINPDGSPQITPIGSLILGKPGHAIYFEKFPSQLPRNLEINNAICILAVNSSKWFWLKSLLKGNFTHPPALRLHGKTGQLRKATETEILLWNKRVQSVKFTKGHKLMWQEMSMVREVLLTKISPVHIGQMTSELNKKID